MKNRRLLYLDTNIFIYYFQEEKILGPKAKKVFESLITHEAEGVTSMLTQVELLSIPTSEKNLQNLLTLFLETPHLKIENLTAEIACDAARIRRKYGFRTPDAIQLATAVYAQVDVFITNDKRLQKFKEIKVILL